MESARKPAGGASFELQLEHSEERLRLLIESVTDYAIFMLDPTGVVVSWNTGAQRMMGYTEEDIVGKHFSTFYTKEDIDRNHPANELKIALEQGRYEEEGWRLRKDGSRFLSNVVITPVLEEDGTLRGFAKVTRDVTHKRLLEESEHRFRLLVDSVRDYGICLLDPTGIVTSWNLGAQNIIGYAPDEIIGKHFSIFYTQEDKTRDFPSHELQSAIKDGRFEDEGWRIRKDGSYFWANVIITAIYDIEGKLTGFAKITRDMTRRREMELQLRDLNRQLEAFAYSVSHDLRAPLRAVAFTSRILLDELGPQLNAEHKELIQMQYSSATKLAQIVDDLLHLARISRQELDREMVDISGVAQDVSKEIVQKEGRTGCKIEIEEGLQTLGDQTLIRVILRNLLDNGCKFSPKGGCVAFGYDKDEEAFFVRDQGIGFEMQYADKVFLPFERLVTDQEFEGTGIGLANVQRAVLRHGGRVWVKSKVGAGTTFYFTLPSHGHG